MVLSLVSWHSRCAVDSIRILFWKKKKISTGCLSLSLLQNIYTLRVDFRRFCTSPLKICCLFGFALSWNLPIFSIRVLYMWVLHFVSEAGIGFILNTADLMLRLLFIGLFVHNTTCQTYHLKVPLVKYFFCFFGGVILFSVYKKGSSVFPP